MWPGTNPYPQQPIMFIPVDYSKMGGTTPQPDPFKSHRKLQKWIKKYQEEQKKSENQRKPQDKPKTNFEKFFGEKSVSYGGVAKYVIAFGPPATYMWALFMIHMWNNLKDSVSALH